MRTIYFFTFLFLLNSCALFTPRIDGVLYQDFWIKNRNPDIKSLPDIVVNLNEIQGSDQIYDYVKRWKEENQVPSISEQKKRALSPKNIKQSINLLPKIIYDSLAMRAERIILASNLGVPLIVLPIYLKNDQQTGRFLIFIDKNINFRGLNDWYNWREKTAFIQNQETEKGIKIDAYLSHGNSISDTIHYLFSQAIALMISWSPEFFPKNLETNNFSKYPLTKLSWVNKKQVIHSSFDHITKKDFPYISFYGQSSRKYSFEKVFEFYQVLDRSNYVNLYSATGPLKDFVETLSLYIHAFYYNRPFRLGFYKNGNLLDSFSNCLKQVRCLKKNYQANRILSTFLDSSSAK